MNTEDTITMFLNEPAMKAWKYGWISCTLDSKHSDCDQKMFKLVLTKEQYRAYPGSIYNP